nr:WbqC family protein [Thermoflexibacter sp.]
MKVAVLQSNYLPWKGYFDIIGSVDAFIFYDEVQYTKNDWRNRNKLYGANGEFWLTIPIDKNAVKQKISEVKIGNSTWQSQHFKSIYLTYKRAPYFSQIEALLHE